MTSSNPVDSSSADETAPRSAAARTWDEQLYQATMTNLDAPIVEESWQRKVIILVVSGLLFAAFVRYWAEDTLQDTAILVAIIFFHELGHYSAMRFFGYRNTKIIFIPFFGGLATGTPPHTPAWQRAVILLLGPAPGILLGAVMQWLYPAADYPVLHGTGVLLVIINGFNLLPITPLDGGQLVYIFIFSRNAYLAAVFTLLAACSLTALAWVMEFWALAVVAVAMFVAAFSMLWSTFSTLRGTAAAAPPPAPQPQLPADIGKLDDHQRRELFGRVLALHPDEQELGELADSFRSLHGDSIAVNPPGLLVSFCFLAIYLSAIAAAWPTLGTEWARWQWKENMTAANRMTDQGKAAEGLLIRWTALLSTPALHKIYDLHDLASNSYLWVKDIANLHVELRGTATADSIATNCDRLASHPSDPMRVAPGIPSDRIDRPKAIAACEQALHERPDEARLLYIRGRARTAAAGWMAPSDQAAGSAYIADFNSAMAKGYPMAFHNMAIAIDEGRDVANNRNAATELYVQYFNRVLFCCWAPVARHLLAEADKLAAAGHDRPAVLRVVQELTGWTSALGSVPARDLLAELVAAGNLPPTPVASQDFNTAKFTATPPWFSSGPQAQVRNAE